MRIDEIRIQNFKHFKDQSFRFHPQFNLVIGVNGSGKTALLNAISVAIAPFVNGRLDAPSQRRRIEESEVRIAASQINDVWRFDPVLPTRIDSTGLVFSKPNQWYWEKTIEGVQNAAFSCDITQDLRDAVQGAENGHWVSFPVLTFYGCDRLWRQTNPLISPEESAVLKVSRFDGYLDWCRAGANADELSKWIISQTTEQAIKALQNNGELPAGYNELSIVNKAIAGCLENAKEVRYDPLQKLVVVEFEDRDPVPFRNLSDGQRVLLAMVGDIARRATILNPHLGENVLLETPGVVLVDELDLHLHPKWQRRVIEDLRRTFPKIQFICTTHSPFLIQTLRSSEELISLDGDTASSFDNYGIEAITAGVMGVSNPEVSPRYFEMLEAAKAYLAELDEAARSPADRLEAYKEQLANRLAPFADNPAFQAVLEMERLAKLGE